MPHDKNGLQVQVGDEVLIRARVRDVWPEATTCQIAVVTVEKMLPEHEAGTHITLNARQVERVVLAQAAPEPGDVNKKFEPVGTR